MVPSSWISGWKDLESEVLTRVGARNELEFAMAQVYGAVLNFHRNRAYFVKDMPFVEDLVSNFELKIYRKNYLSKPGIEPVAFLPRLSLFPAKPL